MFISDVIADSVSRRRNLEKKTLDFRIRKLC